MRISTRMLFLFFSLICLGVGAGKVDAAVDPDKLTLGGEVRERYELRQNADFNANAKDTLSFVGSRIRMQLGYEVTPDIGFFIQMQDSRLFGSETTTISNEKNLDLHQGTITVKNLIASTAVILGRQEMVFGDSRLIGNLGWSNVGRSFDGLRVIYNPGPVRVDLWATTVKLYGTNVGADPGFPSATNQDGQQFYGIYSSVKKGAVTLEPYVLYLRDTGSPVDVNITNPAALGQDRWTIGFRADGKLMADAVDFTGEAAYQTGTMDGRGTTPESDVSAYALALKTGYTMSSAVRPRIGIEYDLASGDDTPGDDAFNTFENLFHTNHMHYGYIDYVGWRNMQDIRFSFGVKPTKTSAVNLDYHLFSLAEEADNWYRAAGTVFRTTPTGNTETDLGQEIDLTAFTMIKEKIRLEAGYARFIPGDYVKVNFPASDDASDFVYVQTGIGF